MIPKKIHYIWLGGEIPKKVQEVIEHNSQFFKEYEVKVWSEENMPPLNAFAQRAYNEKRWAFVSDYLRFYILYQEGGIYLDTDMQVLKALDELLEHQLFSGWDRRGEYIYAGIIGTEEKSDYIESIIKSYNSIEEGIYPTSPQIMTEVYRDYKHKEELKLFESQYFYPLLDGEVETEARLKDAYTNHLWFESWRSFVGTRRFLRRFGLIPLYHKLLSKGKK
jgi:mannosyltransferase OCH1-like enzyme